MNHFNHLLDIVKKNIHKVSLPSEDTINAENYNLCTDLK